MPPPGINPKLKLKIAGNRLPGANPGDIPRETGMEP